MRASWGEQAWWKPPPPGWSLRGCTHGLADSDLSTSGVDRDARGLPIALAGAEALYTLVHAGGSY